LRLDLPVSAFHTCTIVKLARRSRPCVLIHAPRMIPSFRLGYSQEALKKRIRRGCLFFRRLAVPSSLSHYSPWYNRRNVPAKPSYDDDTPQEGADLSHLFMCNRNSLNVVSYPRRGIGSALCFFAATAKVFRFHRATHPSFRPASYALRLTSLAVPLALHGLRLGEYNRPSPFGMRSLLGSHALPLLWWC